MILFLLILEIFLFWQNYIPGTYFLGWDNLFPEMNFGENIRRSFFSVWQEYRGLGLLDGMSFAANLPHYLFLYFLSFFLPQNILRYFFFFLMHFLGGVGMYKLISNFKFQISNKNQSKTAALLGALFYQYNLATIQMFFAPYELFAVHFAFLPWLALFVLRFLGSGRRGDLFKFALLSFFAIPQAHVPTIFLVYFFALLVFAAFFLLYERGLVLREKIKRVFSVFFLTFSLNAFWSLPYIYSSLQNAEIIANSKINQMSTEEIYLRNKVFGDLGNLVKMKGFFFEVMERKPDEGREYLLARWREHTQKPLFLFISSFFFFLSIVGVGRALFKREKFFYPFVFLFFFSIFILGGKLPLVSFFHSLFYEQIPLFKQIFRFTFTKFAFLYAFSFTVLLVLGAGWVGEKLAGRGMVKKFFWGGIFLSLFLYSLPAFQGYFLSSFFKVKIPQEYFAVVKFFKNQEKNTRVATLPQPDFWGWTYTSWGYRGSGFFWYGIPQATMDGAFYSWSRENENYYWEISYALYSGKRELLEKVLEKYRISWLLLDENIINPDSPKALYFEKLEEILSQSKKISLVREFGKIRVYKTNKTYGMDRTYRKEAARVEPGYTWGNFDQAYFEGGNYWTNLSNESNGTYWFYPFRSIFTRGRQEEREFEIENREKEFILRERRENQNMKNAKLVVPEVEEELVEVEKEDLGKVRFLKPEVEGNESKNTLETAVNKVFVKGEELRVRVPKVWGGYSYNSEKDPDFAGKKIFQRNASLDVYLPNLPHRYSYLVMVEARNLSGRPLLFWLENLNSRRQDLQTYLEQGESWQKHYFILPPMEKDGMGYTLHFENSPIGGEKIENQLRQVTVNLFPYKFLTGLKLVKISPDRTKNQPLLVLPQSFEKGWKLYQVKSQKSKVKSFLAEKLPFVFGEEVKEHVLVNNWANGWLVEEPNQPPDTRYKILFWPQYLEYLGFLIITVIMIIISITIIKNVFSKLYHLQQNPQKHRGY